MQLTTQSTETLVRRFASASKGELQKCATELKSMAADNEQSTYIRDCARHLATMVRKQIRDF